jgi:hypothetical protein
MVASAIYLMDGKGKVIISRNYRGDIPMTVSDRLALFLCFGIFVFMCSAFSVDFHFIFKRKKKQNYVQCLLKMELLISTLRLTLSKLHFLRIS